MLKEFFESKDAVIREELLKLNQQNAKIKKDLPEIKKVLLQDYNDINDVLDAEFDGDATESETATLLKGLTLTIHAISLREPHLKHIFNTVHRLLIRMQQKIVHLEKQVTEDILKKNIDYFLSEEGQELHVFNKLFLHIKLFRHDVHDIKSALHMFKNNQTSKNFERLHRLLIRFKHVFADSLYLLPILIDDEQQAERLICAIYKEKFIKDKLSVVGDELYLHLS